MLLGHTDHNYDETVCYCGCLISNGGEFDRVWDELNPENSSWTLSNYSARGENMNVMWIKNDYCALPILRAGATIRLKMERVMRQRLTLVRNTYKWSDKGTGK